MQYSQLIWVSMLSIGLAAPAYAKQPEIAGNKIADDTALSTSDKLSTSNDNNQPLNNDIAKASQPALENSVNTNGSIKDLKNLKIDNFKVNATAALPENEKDPLQPLNRQIYAFNDVVDQNVLRPIAVQYADKVPEQVRDSLRGFRDNLGEPWNAVNQVAQGRFKRAAQTFGRFTLNTITTLGFADPARRLSLPMEDEDFGTTLGYYGVPSGPYLVLPFMGPSTFRDTVGRVVDSQARPQKYLLDGHDRIYYSDWALSALDTRAQLLEIEQVLQGDKYAAMRDAYLQRKNYVIAEKRGLETGSGLFIEDDFSDDESFMDESMESE